MGVSALIVGDHRADDSHLMSGCLPGLDDLPQPVSSVAASGGTQVAGWMTLKISSETILWARRKCTITISVGLPKPSAFIEKCCNVCSEAMACLEFCLQPTGVPISATCQGQTNLLAESSHGEPLASLVQRNPS